MLTLLGSHDTPRVLTECGGSTDMVRLLFTLLLTMPGAPLVYYGDENGMEGENDPGCRRPMVWDESLWKRDVRGLVTTLIRLRREHSCLRRGRVRTAFANDRMYAYYREHDDHDDNGYERALVVINNTALERGLPLRVDFPDGTCLVDALGGGVFEVSEGCIDSRWQARTPYVLVVERGGG